MGVALHVCRSAETKLLVPLLPEPQSRSHGTIAKFIVEPLATNCVKNDRLNTGISDGASPAHSSNLLWRGLSIFPRRRDMLPPNSRPESILGSGLVDDS